MTSISSHKKTSSLRLLIISPEPLEALVRAGPVTAASSTPFPAFLEILTGTKPSKDLTTLAGYTDHAPLHLKTRYYETDVNIWCDVLPTTLESKHDLSLADNVSISPSDKEANNGGDNDPPITTLQVWQDQMISSSALEVRRAIGSIILVLPFATNPASQPSSRQRSERIQTWIPYIEAVSTLRDAIEDDTAREVGSIVVLQDMTPASQVTEAKDVLVASEHGDKLLEDLEDECLSSRGIMGWDFVSWRAEDQPSTSTEATEAEPDNVRNKFGEKVGIARVKEVLQGVDWSASAHDDEDDDRNDLFDEDDLGGHAVTGSDDLNELLKSPFITTGTLSTPPSQSHAPSASTNAQVPNPKGAMASADPHADVWSALDTDAITADAASFEEDKQITQLQNLMNRAVAMREKASGLPTPEDRERFARREVRKLMAEDGW